MATTVWADFISGQVQENPLSNVATTLTMSGRLQDLPTIAAPNEAYLTIDPEGVDVLAGSGTEVVKVTAYTHAAGTATIARGQRGTTGRPHSQGVKVTLSWMAEDVKTTIQVEGVDYHTAKKIGFDGDANITVTPNYSSVDDKVELSFALVDGAGSGLDADTLDGHDTSYFATATSLSGYETHAEHTKAQHDALDIDADTLDGHDSGYFAVAAGSAPSLAAESTDRQTADTSLQNQITTEVSNRGSADTTLQNNINSEASTRASADTAIADALKLRPRVIGVGTPIAGSAPPAGTDFMVQFGKANITSDGSGGFHIDLPTTFPNGVLWASIQNASTIGVAPSAVAVINDSATSTSQLYGVLVQGDGTLALGFTIDVAWRVEGW